MSQHFGDLEGVETDINDIIVHAETEMKPDCRLNSVLDRCKKINLTLNKGKCVFKVKEVTFIGQKLPCEIPPWNSMEIHGNLWKSMEFHGNRWKSMEFHGTSMEYPWSSMECHGVPRSSMK